MYKKNKKCQSLSCQLAQGLSRQGLSRTRKKEGSPEDSRTELGVVTPAVPCHTPARVAQRCHLPSSHCTNISSWVVRSGPWVEGERIRQRTGWLEPNDLLPYHIFEGGLVLNGLQKNLGGPLPLGRSCLLAGMGWKLRLRTCPSPSDRRSTTASSHLEMCLQTTEHVCLW